MEIIRISEYEEKVLEAVNHLLPQLSSSASPMDMESLSELLSSHSTILFLAEEEGEYYGMLSLGFYKIPTGIKVWIEDVVVDKNARGKGLGKQLTLHGIKIAKELGAKSVELTSRPTRKAANKLYKKLGFELRETNVYRLKLS